MFAGLEIFPGVMVLCVAAFVAGTIDAVVGGGGLVQVPALFSVLPNQVPATLLGTNKLMSVTGTASATWRYAQGTRVEWGAALPTAATAFVFAFLGAMAVAHISADVFRPLILPLLIAVAVYTYIKKDFGQTHAPRQHGLRGMLAALMLGAVIGFYDGFFGPGAGSFLVFLFIRFFGFSFLSASVAAKVVNITTNIASILYFGATGHILVALALLMAVFNIAGAQVGSHLALKHGSGFVRRLFLVVVSAAILKFAYDTFFKA